MQEYINYRMEQLKEFARVLEFFESEHKLEPYIDGLKNVLQEIGGKNDSQTKLDNAFALAPSIFFDDLSAIVKGEELPLPHDLLAIPKYLAEKERLKEEAERKQQAEDPARERQQVMAMWQQRDLEEKEKKRAEICAQLGISEKTLCQTPGGGIVAWNYSAIKNAGMDVGA